MAPRDAFHEPHEFQLHSPVESGGAPPHSKTLARRLRSPRIRQVFECAAAAALWVSHEVQGLNARQEWREGFPGTAHCKRFDK